MMKITMRSLYLVTSLPDAHHAVPVPSTTLQGIAIMPIPAMSNLPVLLLHVQSLQFPHGTREQAVLTMRPPIAFLIILAALLVISGMGQSLS